MQQDTVTGGDDPFLRNSLLFTGPECQAILSALLTGQSILIWTNRATVRVMLGGCKLIGPRMKLFASGWTKYVPPANVAQEARIQSVSSPYLARIRGFYLLALPLGRPQLPFAINHITQAHSISNYSNAQMATIPPLLQIDYCCLQQ